MAVLDDVLVIDGYQHEDLPTKFVPILNEYADQIIVSKATVDASRVVLINGATPITGYDGAEQRKIRRISYEISWEGGFLSRQLHDQLAGLYSLNQSFWVQFDNEMTRSSALLFPSDLNDYNASNYQTYFTPTFPIAPYGYEPTDVRVYPGTIFIGATPVYYDFTVDSETGTIRIKSASLTSKTIQVRMAYTWKAFVRIKQFDLTPTGGIAAETYSGNIQLEMVTPNYYNDNWYTLPTDSFLTQVDVMQYQSGGYPIPSGGATVSWGDTRYITSWT